MSARFPKTYCSSCGGEFGPGNGGYSHCDQHPGPARDRLHAAAPAMLSALREAYDALSAHPDDLGEGEYETIHAEANRRVLAAIIQAGGQP